MLAANLAKSMSEIGQDNGFLPVSWLFPYLQTHELRLMMALQTNSGVQRDDGIFGGRRTDSVGWVC
jgi:hypothetical protein